MDGGEIPESAVRNAILSSHFNPRRNLMVPLVLYSNNGAETRFSVVGSPSPASRDVSPVVRKPVAAESVMVREAAKQGGVKHRLSLRGCARCPKRGCMRYQPPYHDLAGRHDVVSEMQAVAHLPPIVHDGNTCTAWVFYTMPEAAVDHTEELAATGPLDIWADYPAEVKNPRAERGSNDTVISFLA
jgi:hypothetical protein